MESTSRKKGLQIGIVGAGLAGLSAAIALRGAGHEVEVRLSTTAMALSACSLHSALAL